MTFSDLKTLVWSWLDDPNGGYFTDAQVGVFINNAARQVQKKLIQSGDPWYGETVQTVLSANLNTYTLPSDFLKLHRIDIFLNGTFPNETRCRLIPVTPVEADRFPTGTGTPECYWIYKGNIVFAKTPDTAYTIEMLYSYAIVDMVNGTDVPDVPTQYQEMIAIYATLDGYLKDQRDPNPVFAQKLAMYEQSMVQDAQERNVDEGRYVNCTESETDYICYY